MKRSLVWLCTGGSLALGCAPGAPRSSHPGEWLAGLKGHGHQVHATSQTASVPPWAVLDSVPRPSVQMDPQHAHGHGIPNVPTKVLPNPQGGPAVAVDPSHQAPHNPNLDPGPVAPHKLTPYPHGPFGDPSWHKPAEAAPQALSHPVHPSKERVSGLDPGYDLGHHPVKGSAQQQHNGLLPESVLPLDPHSHHQVKRHSSKATKASPQQPQPLPHLSHDQDPSATPQRDSSPPRLRKSNATTHPLTPSPQSSSVHPQSSNSSPFASAQKVRTLGHSKTPPPAPVSSLESPDGDEEATASDEDSNLVESMDQETNMEAPSSDAAKVVEPEDTPTILPNTTEPMEPAQEAEQPPVPNPIPNEARGSSLDRSRRALISLPRSAFEPSETEGVNVPLILDDSVRRSAVLLPSVRSASVSSRSTMNRPDSILDPPARAVGTLPPFSPLSGSRR